MPVISIVMCISLVWSVDTGVCNVCHVVGMWIDRVLMMLCPLEIGCIKVDILVQQHPEAQLPGMASVLIARP